MILTGKYLPHYTYDDYKNWEGDWELIDGIPYAMAPPTRKHQILMTLIFQQVFKQVEVCSRDCQVLFEVNWIVNTSTVVRPDLLVVCYDKSEDFVRKTPEVVFEIVSPSSAIKDENIKFLLYQQEGVKYYVLFYPDEKRIKIYKLINGRFVKVFDNPEGSFKLEGECPFEIKLDELWEKL
jgi:Uma2 family endonuclease